MVSQPYAATVTTTVERHIDYSEERTVINITNNGTATIYIGVDASMTTSNGYPLQAGQTAIIRKPADDPRLNYFMVADSGSQNIRIWEGYGAV